MKRKFTKRDAAFLFLGILVFFLVDSALNWDQCLKGMKDGAEAAARTEIQK